MHFYSEIKLTAWVSTQGVNEPDLRCWSARRKPVKLRKRLIENRLFLEWIWKIKKDCYRRSARTTKLCS